MNYFHSLACALFIILISCDSNAPLPKPVAYYEMDFPVRDSLLSFQMNECHFTFKYPNYIEVEQDTLFFNEKPDDPCWLNLKYPTLNGIVHMSYKSLNKNDLYSLTEDYHRMKNKHVVKANYIDESEIKNEDKHLYGLISDVGGDVASSYQFYITDSTENFVRGSLYFRTEPNADSLKPAVLFVRNDVIDILNSWEWE